MLLGSVVDEDRGHHFAKQLGVLVGAVGVPAPHIERLEPGQPHVERVEEVEHLVPLVQRTVIGLFRRNPNWLEPIRKCK